MAEGGGVFLGICGLLSLCYWRFVVQGPLQVTIRGGKCFQVPMAIIGSLDIFRRCWGV
jgi:hypothetical protein